MISFEAEKKIFPSILKKRHESLGTILYFFLKEIIFFNFFSIFYDFLKKITRFSEKITLHFSRLRSQILLNNYRFWDFSLVIQHMFN